MDAASPTAGLSTPPDPPKDRHSKPVPEQIAYVLAIVRILLGYGRHLQATLEHRATQRSFSVIAQFFGTARLPVILARLSRGVLRAIALERVLLARAARGRDLVAKRPKEDRPPREKPSKPPADATTAEQQPPQPQPQPKPKPALRRSWDDTPDLAHLPTLEELEAEIRRGPIGRALADICCDLGVFSTLCESRFCLAICEVITWYRGNFAKYYQAVRKRQREFLNELDQDRTFTFDWPEQTRDAMRRGLGFFIGEEPVSPFPSGASPVVAKAVATGPP